MLDLECGADGLPMTDEFMLYKFKVLPCTRKQGAHSWTECPYTHPGEKAARRCPKTHIYSPEACPDARKSGKCARGDLCPYSHGVFEQWLHPSRYRTQLCSFGTACRRPVCFFAHTVQELRVPTACGPVAAAAAAAAAACSPLQVAPQVAAAAAAQMAGLSGQLGAAAAAGKEDAYAAMVQQALLAQMAGATALHGQPLDGATATFINRYQASSCAALANAAACQQQQRQHQQAAAAAAAAAMSSAAAANPACLLHMAQAARAYQAAAAAAAAAAASVHTPPGHVPSGAYGGAAMLGGGTQSSGSSVGSPTGSTTGANGAASLSSLSTFADAQEPLRASDLTGGLGGSGGSGGSSIFDSYLLQQALANAGAGPWNVGGGGALPPSPATSSPPMPWLPASAPAPSGVPIEASLACGGYGPAGMALPATPGMSNAASCALDTLADQWSRQLSLQAYQS